MAVHAPFHQRIVIDGVGFYAASEPPLLEHDAAGARTLFLSVLFLIWVSAMIYLLANIDLHIIFDHFKLGLIVLVSLIYLP